MKDSSHAVLWQTWLSRSMYVDFVESSMQNMSVTPMFVKIRRRRQIDDFEIDPLVIAEINQKFVQHTIRLASFPEKIIY